MQFVEVGCRFRNKQSRFLCFVVLVCLVFFSNAVLAKKLRVMTWNILASEYTDSQTGSPADRFGINPVWRQRLPLATRVIQTTKPDIIGFQEDMQSQSSDLLRAFAGSYESVTFHHPQGFSYAGSKLLGSIFYDPIKFKEMDFGTFDVLFGRATWVRLQDLRDPELRYVVFNFHWRGESSERQAMSSVTNMLRIVRDDDKVIALGDFNASTSTVNKPKNILNVSELLTASGYEQIHTKNVVSTNYINIASEVEIENRRGIFATIDGIYLAGNDIQFSSDSEMWMTGVGPLDDCWHCHASDHFAVVADFTVKSRQDIAINIVVSNLLLSE